jgi:integrase
MITKCPCCGYIFPQEKRTNKRKRLPNGFGQIVKISDKNLRNPYRAMITVGKTEYGKPICKILKPRGYFASYNEAYEALIEYHKDPYSLDSEISCKELYERWSGEYFKTLKGDSSIRTIKAAWSRCNSIYDLGVKYLRARHIKGCIEACESPNMKSRVKSLFNLMLDYALEYELVDKNYARTFKISDEVLKESEESKRNHIPFTDEEIRRLWENISLVPYADIVLIQCYTGLRPQELGLIELKNVDLDRNIFVGGMKTEAGTDRTIPIHSRIKPLIIKRYGEALRLGSEYLFNCTDTHSNHKLTYDKYQYRFQKIVMQLMLNPDHRPHDPRKHFATMAKKYQVDEYAIKYIIGHAITDITEKIYTEREISWLVSEMEKIK